MVETNKLIVGYHPLLYVDNKHFGKMYDSKDHINNIAKMVDELPNIEFKGIMWVSEEEHLMPVIICNRAKEVARHLSYYSEGAPRDWFKLCHGICGTQYGIVLMPDIEKSIKRQELAQNIMNTTGINTSFGSYGYIFKPIHCISVEVSAVYTKFCEQNLAKSKLCLIDIKDINVFTIAAQSAAESNNKFNYGRFIHVLDMFDVKDLRWNNAFSYVESSLKLDE